VFLTKKVGTMFSKKVFLFPVFFLPIFLVAHSEDPFSEITVSSDKALFKRVEAHPETYRLEYDGDVSVSLADGTIVTSKNLKVFVKTGGHGPSRAVHEDNFLGSEPEVEQVVFLENVEISRKNQKILADRIEIVVPEKCCYAKGHVKIMQESEGEVEVPLQAECAYAQIRWEDDEIFLRGDKNRPVCTRLILGKKINLIKK